MKNTDLHVKMVDCFPKDICLKKISIKLWCLYLVQHMLHQIKAQQFYTDLYRFRFPMTVLNPPEDGKIQVLSKAN